MLFGEGRSERGRKGQIFDFAARSYPLADVIE
jgi:hypothetical protein